VLYILRRAHDGKQPKTATCVIDSQSVRSAENNNTTIDRYGFYTGKSINRRHILTDSAGLRLAAMAHQAGIQDRDGGSLLVAMPIGKMFAASGDAGPIFREGVKKRLPQLNVEIIRRRHPGKYCKTLINR
jgi:hypothetical protein